MSNIKQLLEKANRKCEMRWRVFAFDPAKDNELVHTSKDAFDCIVLDEAHHVSAETYQKIMRHFTPKL